MKKTLLVSALVASLLGMMTASATTYNYTVDVKNAVNAVLVAKDNGSIIGSIPQNGEHTFSVRDSGNQLVLLDPQGIDVCNPTGSSNTLDLTEALSAGINHFTVNASGSKNDHGYDYSCDVNGS